MYTSGSNVTGSAHIPRWRVVVALVIVCLAEGPSAQHRMLEQLLTAAGIDQRIALELTHRAVVVESHVIDSTAIHISIAYLIAGSRADGVIGLAVYDRAAQRWRERHISSEARHPNSVLRLQHTADRVIVDTHVNPSAGVLVVCDAALDRCTSQNGWSLAILPNGLVVYQVGQVHFAPTHSLEIGLADAAAKATLIYPPPTPSPVRVGFAEQMRQLYSRLGDDWLRRNNHHGDPDRFDSSLVGSPSVDWASRRLTFKVRFGDDQHPGWPTANVDVTCTGLDIAARTICSEELQPER